MFIQSEIRFKNSILKNTRKNYTHLIQYVLKKGNKNKIENMFRFLLFFLSKKYVLQNKFEFQFILKAFINTTPRVNVKTKRKGSKNIYIPVPVKRIYSKYLSAH
jgi:ribosomal protein S7